MTNIMEEYLENYPVNVKKLARKAGIASATIYNVLKGQDIKNSIAAKIEIATEGKVTCMGIAAYCASKKKSCEKNPNKSKDKRRDDDEQE